MEEYALSLKMINKSYPGVQALKAVNLNFRKGEIHAIVGENGAGKSTLIKIISGALEADSGEIMVFGETLRKLTPLEAIKKGIAVIYQERMEVESLSVAENVFLGQPIRKGLLIDREEMDSRAKAIFDEFKLNIDPKQEVGTLSVAYRQIVEIAKALSRDCSILIMDEPSAPLTNAEIEVMFRIVRQLKQRGVTVIYISHKLEEIFELTDQISVLRDGEYVTTIDTAATNQNDLIRYMVGRELSNNLDDITERCIAEKVFLRLEHVSGPGVKDISLEVKEGEILGIAGLVGSGRTELMRIIFGVEKTYQGRILVRNKAVRLRNPYDAVRNGIVLVPEDRKKQGLFLEQSIFDNILIVSIRDISKGLFVDKRKAKQLSDEIASRLTIKMASPSQEVKNLSGGNQQKVVLAKWMLKDADMFIFDEPTQGIDVGAKQEIYQLIRQLAQNGKTIIMVSSEMNELIRMADRMIVIHEGTVAGELNQEDYESEKIMTLASGISK